MKIFLLLLMTLSTLLAGIGQITTLKGVAEVTRQSQALEVFKGIQLENRDLLKTHESSKVQAILNDDTVITIGPNSQYLFEQFEDGSNPKIEMRLDRGFFKAVTGKIGKIAPQRFKIKTKAATIGIRGTQFMAFVSDEEERIGCIQGTIIVWTDEGEFIVKAGEMIWYKEKHWRRTVIDLYAFEPVMVGMSSDKDRQFNKTLLLPRFRESYILEEQVLNDLQNQNPFDFALGFDNSEHTPFNP